MDKFSIDGHKAHYHVEQIKTIKDFVQRKDNDNDVVNDYKKMMPVYMEVSPVGACNHRCTFCSVDYIGYESRFLDPAIYQRALEKNNGEMPIKAIMFAGEGEPLLHKEIERFLAINHELGIKSAFTSNATKLFAKRFEKILPYTSWFKTSCNAGDAKTYAQIHRTEEEDFYQAWTNMNEAKKFIDENGLNCNLGVQTLLLPENAKTIKDLVVRAKDSGLDYVVVKPYSQHLSSNNTKHKDIDYSEY